MTTDIASTADTGGLFRRRSRDRYAGRPIIPVLTTQSVTGRTVQGDGSDGDRAMHFVAIALPPPPRRRRPRQQIDRRRSRQARRSRRPSTIIRLAGRGRIPGTVSRLHIIAPRGRGQLDRHCRGNCQCLAIAELGVPGGSGRIAGGTNKRAEQPCRHGRRATPINAGADGVCQQWAEATGGMA